MNLYTWTTPNGYKVPIMLEELNLEYEIIPVNIGKGEQMTPEFLAMNPNHKIPVLVDDEAEGGPLTIFESGAILIYLVEKYKKFQPADTREKYLILEWLMFQMGSVGPMFGQANHFVKHAPEQIPYAIKRYLDETRRIMGVLETRLAQAPFLGGDYSIADIATWPWIRTAQNAGTTDITQFPSVERWYKAIEGRGAVQRAIEKVDGACK